MMTRNLLLARVILEAYHAAHAETPFHHIQCKRANDLLDRAVRILESEAEGAGLVDTWSPKP
jgi:hypothetical protein